MSYLLDTNAVSELMKPVPQVSVVSWLTENEGDCFLCAVSVGEIERGLALLPAGRKKSRLLEAFQDFLGSAEDRILSFDVAVARRWAALTAVAQRKGRLLPVLDSMIEATALHWNLILVTRNVSDFMEAPVIDPWQPRA